MQLSVQLHVLVLLFSCFLSKIFLSLGSVSVPSRNQTSDTLKICWGLSFTVGSSIWFCFQTSLPRNHSCRSWAAEKLKHSSSRLQSSQVLPCKVQVSLASGLTQRDFHWGLDLQGEHIHSEHSWMPPVLSVSVCFVVLHEVPSENSQHVPPKIPEAECCPHPSPAGQGLSLEMQL